MSIEKLALPNSGGVPPARISLAEALVRVRSEPLPYALLFERDDVAVEFFVPRGHDSQTPHSQDELYLVLSGSARLVRGSDSIRCAAGDSLYVPALMDHHFESISDDFRTWVIYFGPHLGS